MNTPPKAWRLICTFDGADVRVTSRRRIEMVVPPTDSLEGYEGRVGFWIELRDRQGRVVYRRSMQSPFERTAEVLVDSVTGLLAHMPIDQVRGTFVVLVPDLDQGEYVALINGTAQPGATQGRPVEVARLPLREADAGNRNKAKGPADGAIVGTTKIVDNGPAAARWNLVILAEGFQEAEQEAFASEAQALVDSLFATPPFNQLQAGINVYRVNVASTESGADNVPLGPTDDGCSVMGPAVRTFFDATFCTNGIARLLTVNRDTVFDVLDEQVPEWQAAAVLVNSSEQGGSGSPLVAVMSRTFPAGARFAHELGHAAFGLGDEYSQEEETPDIYTGPEPDAPNLTIDTNITTNKWRDLIAPGTPMPTMSNPDCTQSNRAPSPFPQGTVGTFEGVYLGNCGVFRPEITCMMQQLTHPFCAVCRRRIRETLTPYLPGVEPMDYVVIIRARQHFGDDEDLFPGVFVGREKDFPPFNCPGIDPAEEAVLMFQSLNVEFENNILTINGESVIGGIPVSGENELWNANILLIAANKLNPTNNILHIAAGKDEDGVVDDFVIDNMVLFYKRTVGIPLPV